MPLLIQGPRQHGNDIDVFLEPVIDELVEMFEKGVEDVWDEYKKEYVTIKAVLIATITDLRSRFIVRREDKRLYWMCRVLERHRCGKSAK
jgi:translation initiation factor IF-2